MKKTIIMIATMAMAVTVFAAQCAAITKKGTRCKRQAVAGALYCWQHGGNATAQRGTEEIRPTTERQKQCKAITEDGEQCELYAAAGSAYCRLHGGASHQSSSTSLEAGFRTGGFDRGSKGVFEKVKDSIVVITGDKGSGTGFIVEMDGYKWLMTNEHVVHGQGKISAKTLSGKKIVLTDTIDMASNRDLVRYKIDGEFRALKWRNDSPSMGEDVWVFGNSDGGGVVTSIGGVILGVGADRIEVSAKFVSGNSGSPVVDNNGDVVGVATLAAIKRDFDDWVKEGTRFNSVRRYAITLGGIAWEPLGYQQYLDDCATMDSYVNQCLGFIAMAEVVGLTRNSRPKFKKAKGLDSSYISAIRKDKKSSNIYKAIIAADAAHEKALIAYDDAETKIRTYASGRIDRPSEFSMKRLQKDIDKTYKEIIKSRKKGLLRAKKLSQECAVKSERAKGEVQEIRDIVDKIVSQIEELYARYGIEQK